MLRRPPPFSTPRYKLRARLARGGQGELYRATCEVVVKRLIRVDDPHHQERIRREFEAARRISHPNVVKVLDGEFGAAPYIVMEYLRGETLSTRMARSRKPRHLLECVRLVLQAMQGVKELHDHGLIHRDLKPDNIFVRQDCEPELAVVLDLGAVRFLTRSQHHGRTTTGMLIGTHGYMAPEQAAGEVVANAADIYALGVVLYEILVGTLPHATAGANERALAEATARIDTLPAWSSGRTLEHLRLQLSAAVMLALARTPEARHPSVEAFALALERALGLAESTICPSAAAAYSPAQPRIFDAGPRARIGWRVTALALTSLVVLLTTASAIVHWRKASPRAQPTVTQLPIPMRGPEPIVPAAPPPLPAPIVPAAPAPAGGGNEVATTTARKDAEPRASTASSAGSVPSKTHTGPPRKPPKPATSLEATHETEEEVWRRMQLTLARQGKGSSSE